MNPLEALVEQIVTALNIVAFQQGELGVVCLGCLGTKKQNLGTTRCNVCGGVGMTYNMPKSKAYLGMCMNYDG